MTNPAGNSPSSSEGYVVSDDGLRLAFRSWRPDGPSRSTVVVVHGYAEHSGRYAPLAERLAALGHTIVAYDQRGHGRSAGRRAFVRSFDRYVEDLATILAGLEDQISEGPRFLFGHSMGGTVATLFCLERQPAVHGLILSSPALRLDADLSPLLQRLSGVIGMALPLMPTVPLDRTLLSRDPTVVARAQADPLNYHGRMPARTGSELLRAMRRIKARMHEITLPLLLIHGTGDRITDPEGSRDLYRAARSHDKTLGLYPDLYHETFNEPEKRQVYEEITAWLDEHIG